MLYSKEIIELLFRFFELTEKQITSMNEELVMEYYSRALLIQAYQ